MKIVASVSISTSSSDPATADTPQDYTNFQKTLVLPEPGNNRQLYYERIAIVDDALMEDPNEFFYVRINNIGKRYQLKQIAKIFLLL